jgi:hypothetical protein
MPRLQRLILVIVLFAFSACSQNPIVTSETMPTASFTPYVGGTETALAVDLASPTPWVAGTQTALAVSSSSPTPYVAGTQTAEAIPSLTTPEDTLTPLPTVSFPTVTPAVVFSPAPEGTFSPVFYGSGSFLLLGGFKTDRGWLSGADASSYVDPEGGYDFFGRNGPIQVPGSPLEFSLTCRNYFMHSSVVMSEAMVGVASGWVTQRRATTDLSMDDPTYVQAVTEWFQSQGNSPAEIHITRILQADIEGDGVNEILLSASYFQDTSGHMTRTGDYSVVLMRKVTGNDVVTIPLVKDYYVSSVPELELSYPKTYTLAQALDLNRDGTLEVIVHVSRWEGGGAIVYRLDGQNVREVMRTIC